MDKTKVLVLGYLPPPPEGTAKITEVIVNSIYLRDNFEISFLPLLKRHSASSRGKLSFNNIFINFLNYARFLVQIIAFNPKMIYLTLAQNRFGFLRDSLFILIGRIFGKIIIAHFHGGNFDRFFAQQKQSFRKYISKILGKIDRLIVLADIFKLQFNNLVDSKKISTLYNCLPELSCPGPDFKTVKKKGFNKDKIRVLFIGYLSKAKGALDLVQAAPLVISKYEKPIEFILCGQPVDIERNITFISEPHFGYSKMLKLIEDENLNNFVNLRTTLNPGEKENLLENSDIFVFPTYSEGCGIVALEAMAFGLPVITTRVGGLSEMLKENENCLFVEPGDFKSLARQILFLINNEAQAIQMGTNNRNLVSSLYNKDNYIRSLAVIWQNTLSARRG